MRRSTPEKIIGFAMKCCAVLAFFALVLANALSPFGKKPQQKTEQKTEPEGLRLFFMDAGEGDCTVVRFPGGGALVVDAGDGNFDLRRSLECVLGDAEGEDIVYVATHADYDHIGGMADLMHTYGGKQLYLPAIPSELRAYTQMTAAAEEEGIPAKTIKRYEVCTFGEAYFVCISPYSQGEDEENDASAVLYLSYAGVNILLCGDISERREEILRSEYEIDETLFDSHGYAVRLDDIDVLKVAHHGSATSSSEDWLDLLKPEVSVISCGAGNLYGHPAGETLERLAACGSEIYRTDELGTIALTVSPDGTYSMSWEN